MDFMKVVDQAVREIKREVNLKVLKVPEIEQKVLDATDDEPWGPHGTALSEIAQATKKFTECQMVMNVLWTRLGETGKDWRYVYKALAVIEYLIANGSERALDDIIEHTYQISSLTAFEYVEPNGKDMGINVRKKAENIAALLNDSDKIQEVRSKAAATRDKYVGLSSRGITYKSGSATYTGTNFQRSNRYGGFSGRYDSDSYRHKYEDSYQEDSFEKYVPKSQRGASGERKTFCPSRDQEFPSSASSKPSTQNQLNASYETAIVPANSQIDDDDDFDPRGTTSSKPAGSQEVDLFGESLIGDLGDSPTPSPPKCTVNNKSSDVDLFGGADFVSASPQLEVGGNSQTQPKADLFATEPAASAPVSTTMDFFASLNAMLPETNVEDTGQSKDPKLNSVDPFALAPLNNYNGPDLLGAFSSQPGQSSLQPAQNPLNSTATNDMSGKSLPEHKAPLREGTLQVMQNPVNSSAMIELSSKSSQEYKPPPKDTFQVKSGIWADSLSRGLIDLNITAPTKVNLAEIGILGGLSDGLEQKPQAPPASYYMGTSPGMGSTFSRSSSVNSTGSSADAFFSGLQSSQCQLDSFQK